MAPGTARPVATPAGPGRAPLRKLPWYCAHESGRAATGAMVAAGLVALAAALAGVGLLVAGEWPTALVAFGVLLVAGSNAVSAALSRRWFADLTRARRTGATSSPGAPVAAAPRPGAPVERPVPTRPAPPVALPAGWVSTRPAPASAPAPAPAPAPPAAPASPPPAVTAAPAPPPPAVTAAPAPAADGPPAPTERPTVVLAPVGPPSAGDGPHDDAHGRPHDEAHDGAREVPSSTPGPGEGGDGRRRPPPRTRRPATTARAPRRVAGRRTP